MSTKTFAPVLPQLRGSQQAERIGGVLPPSQQPQWCRDDDDDELEVARRLDYGEEEPAFHREKRGSDQDGQRPRGGGGQQGKVMPPPATAPGRSGVGAKQKSTVNLWKSGRSWRQSQRTGDHGIPWVAIPKSQLQDALQSVTSDFGRSRQQLSSSPGFAKRPHTAYEALQISLGPEVELPDATRVIWRGTASSEAAEWKCYEDLEMARHRRDKLREAGEEQRRQARERFKQQQEQERRILLERRRQKEAKRVTRMGELASHRRAVQGTSDDLEYQKDMFAKLPLEMLSVAQIAEFRKKGPKKNKDKTKSQLEQPSVLHAITPKQQKAARILSINNLHKSRRRQERLHRLMETRRREFLSKPETEQRALRTSFQKADVSGTDSLDSRQLRRALDELGLAPKNDAEKKEMKLICDEVCIVGDVDFLTFCSEAVPRTREKLRDMRRGPLRQQFKIYDSDNSGYLDVQECEQILARHYTFSLDEQGQTLMRASFLEAIKQVVQPEIGEVDFDGFETLMATLQEHYQRILLERETDIMNEEGLEEEDVAEHADELVSLYDSFSRGDFDGNAGMDKDELRPLLLEYGLYPRSFDGQTLIQIIFDELDSDKDGSLNFRQFLEILRAARQIFKLNQASDLQKMFEKFDDRFDRDGDETSIDMNEVSLLLGKLGLMPRCRDDQQEMKRILDCIDNGTGQVTFDEFQTLVLRITEHANAAQRRRERQCAVELDFADDQVAELRDAFHALDTEGTNILCIEKLRTALDLLRKDMPAEDLQDMMEVLDPENKGGLNFEKFLHFMHAVT